MNTNSNVVVRGMGMIPISNFTIGTAMSKLPSYATNMPKIVAPEKDKKFTDGHSIGKCCICGKTGWGRKHHTLAGDRFVCIRKQNACGKKLATWISHMAPFFPAVTK